MNIRNTTICEMEYGTNDLTGLLPEVPEEFKNSVSYKYWEEIALTCFNQGLAYSTFFLVKDTLNKEMALRHIKCLINTYFLTKEEKIKYLAYLLSLWFYTVKFN